MAQPTSTTSSSPTDSNPLLKATYKSPTNPPFTQTQTLSVLPTDNASVAQKTSYLAALRKSTADLQETINKELTARMEEDKTREASNGTTAGTGAGTKIDEAKEEDNYGEEVVEED